MMQPINFSTTTKRAAFERQKGKCAYCGSRVRPPLQFGPGIEGDAHHLRPKHHGGIGSLENCAFLCKNCHKFLHGTRVGEIIETQGGSTKDWVMVDSEELPYFRSNER